MSNKVLSCLISLFLLGAGVAKAQMGDQTSIGPRIGVNFSNVSNIEGSKSLTGLVLGLTSTYSITEATGLTVDLLYSQEGYSLNDVDLRLNYLQLPIYFDLFFGELGDKFRPKVYAGIVPGILLSAKNGDAKVDNDFFNTVNFAVSGGLGFNLRMSSRVWLNTDLRAYLGLNDIRDKSLQDGDKNANSTIQLSVGVAYGLSKI